MLRLSTALLLAFAATAVQANISSSVSYDAATSLYTYSYVLERSDLPARADDFELDIKVSGVEDFGFARPVSYNVPPPFDMTLEVIHEPHAGTYYSSEGPMEDASEFRFSFSTATAPDTSSSENYRIDALHLYPNDAWVYTEYGHVIGPEIQPAPAVPEPSPISLLALGTAFVALAARRRQAGKA